MGCGTSTQETNQTSDFTQQTTFAPASPEELALRQQFATLGTAQKASILDAMNRAQSGNLLSLSPADQGRLDEAFNAARQRLTVGGKDYADFLSGSRGLRMSDTPISQQALDRFGLGLADLESQRAQAGLNLGLNTNTLALNTLLQGAQSLPSGSVAAFNPLFQERLGSGTTRTTGRTGGTTISNASPLQQVLQGTQAFNTFTQGLGNLSKIGPNSPAMGFFS